MDKKELEEGKNETFEKSFKSKESNVKLNIKPNIEEKTKIIIEKDTEYEVKSCCGSICSIEKPYLEFIAKFIISGSVLAFSMIQLANNRGDTSYFASTISLILGIYINNKTEKREKKEN